VAEVENPKIVLIVACAGLAANILSGTFLGVHEHGHEHGAGNLDLELLVRTAFVSTVVVSCIDQRQTPHQDLGHRHHIKAAEGKKPRWKKLFSHDHSHGPAPSHEHNHGSAPSPEHTDHEDAHSHSHSHEHDHSHGHASHGHHHDLGMQAVLIHLMGDAFNNIGVIISALIIWKTTSENRFYADPAVSMVIGIVLVLTALKLGD